MPVRCSILRLAAGAFCMIGDAVSFAGFGASTALTTIGYFLWNFRQICGFVCGEMPLTALPPKGVGNFQRVNIALLPPLSLIAGGVNVLVVYGAKRNGELIAHLVADASRLGVTDVVSV